MGNQRFELRFDLPARYLQVAVGRPKEGDDNGGDQENAPADPEDRHDQHGGQA